jgi:hypothetical protein
MIRQTAKLLLIANLAFGCNAGGEPSSPNKMIDKSELEAKAPQRCALSMAAIRMTRS